MIQKYQPFSYTHMKSMNKYLLLASMLVSTGSVALAQDGLTGDEIIVEIKPINADNINSVIDEISDKLKKIEQLEQKMNNVLQALGRSDEIENPVDANGYIAVDLGVVYNGKPLYWAVGNLGAYWDTDAGDYYAYAETSPHYAPGHALDNPCTDWMELWGKQTTGYNLESYRYYDASNKMLTKYNFVADKGVVDNKIELDPEDDPVRKQWQGDWRMPTLDELVATFNQADLWIYETTNSQGEAVTCYLLSKPGDINTYIILPQVGVRSGDALFGEYGNYLTSTMYEPYNEPTGVTFNLVESAGYYSQFCVFNRFEGMSIRPVCSPTDVKLSPVTSYSSLDVDRQAGNADEDIRLVARRVLQILQDDPQVVKAEDAFLSLQNINDRLDALIDDVDAKLNELMEKQNINNPSAQSAAYLSAPNRAAVNKQHIDMIDQSKLVRVNKPLNLMESLKQRKINE